MLTFQTKMRKKISNEILRTSNSAKTYHELIKYYVSIEHKLREMNLLNKFKKNNNFKSSEERSQSDDKLTNDRSHAKNSSSNALAKTRNDAKKSKYKNKLRSNKSKNKKNFRFNISLKDIICYDCNQKNHYKKSLIYLNYEKKNEDRNRDTNSRKVKI